MPIDREQFLAQRSPRRGAANPERMVMPVWEWLVATRASAYAVNQQFEGPSPFTAGPAWCFDRFGCSRTVLPDGRVLHIAGEHEDWYDPDFYIYNDVVVRHPDGAVEIFGYPEDVFPPTDFHSATPVGDRIVVVGNLGYPAHRRPDRTPVFELTLATMSITARPTSGDAPSWLHRHVATLDAGSRTLHVGGGSILTADGELRENHTDWALCLDSWRWSRLREHPFEQWSVWRTDAERLMLSDLDFAAFETRHPAAFDAETSSLQRLAASGRRFDAAAFSRLFAPDVPHSVVATEIDVDDEPPTDEPPDAAARSVALATIRVGDAVVRYHDEDTVVEMRIEGRIDPALAGRLFDDLVAQLANVQGAPCEGRRDHRQG